MSTSASADVSLDRVSNEPSRSVDDDILSRLIAAASASLDSDRATAKEYIEQAAELLRVAREERLTAPSAFSSMRGGLASWQKRRVAAYVETNVASNIKAIDLARMVRLSKGHFFRAFRASFGEPPMAYVAKRRIVLAQELMRTSRVSLSQIALACGMCDQPHFTRVFHKIVGVSPGVWRRQFAGGREGSVYAAPLAGAVR